MSCGLDWALLPLTGTDMLDELILQSCGRIVACDFVKKDGTTRKIVGRLGVTSYLKGGKSTLNPDTYITIFDMQKQAYRSINRSTILSVTTGGVRYV